MWSGIALPSTSSRLFWRHRSRRISPIPFLNLPYNAFFRYFGKITTWYMQSHFTWAWLCQSLLMTVLLSPFGAFLKEDRLSQTTLERQSLMNSHRQSRWISYDLAVVNSGTLDRYNVLWGRPPAPDRLRRPPDRPNCLCPLRVDG